MRLDALTVRTEDDLRGALDVARPFKGRDRGPSAIVAKVTESAPTAKPPLDCVFIKHRFMAALRHP